MVDLLCVSIVVNKKNSKKIMPYNTIGLPQDEVVVPRETVAWAEAWLVVYSITSLESFRVCVRAVEAVTTACGGDQPNPPVLIMANKKDLEHIREVRGMRKREGNEVK
uniref:small monomeric GTPase n=1 Tax=Scylla olivacea TaxID=85551 RepID=A0A0P4WIQ0_SCYOL